MRARRIGVAALVEIVVHRKQAELETQAVVGLRTGQLVHLALLLGHFCTQRNVVSKERPGHVRRASQGSAPATNDVAIGQAGQPGAVAYAFAAKKFGVHIQRQALRDRYANINAEGVRPLMITLGQHAQRACIRRMHASLPLLDKGVLGTQQLWHEIGGRIGRIQRCRWKAGQCARSRD